MFFLVAVFPAWIDFPHSQLSLLTWARVFRINDRHKTYNGGWIAGGSKQTNNSKANAIRKHWKYARKNCVMSSSSFVAEEIYQVSITVVHSQATKFPASNKRSRFEIIYRWISSEHKNMSNVIAQNHKQEKCLHRKFHDKPAKFVSLESLHKIALLHSYSKKLFYRHEGEHKKVSETNFRC